MLVGESQERIRVTNPSIAARALFDRLISMKKIKVLQNIERESYYTGEMMGWKIGDLEEASIDDKRGSAEINWG